MEEKLEAGEVFEQRDTIDVGLLSIVPEEILNFLGISQEAIKFVSVDE